jgi:hypothetical protein
MRLFTSLGDPFFIDDEDYDRIKQYRWYKSGKYICAHINGGSSKIQLHRLIMNAKDGAVVDHINGHRNDNRKCNLRIVNYTQNAMNSAKRSDNTSSCTGVSWDKTRQKWFVKITCYGKQRNLGRYSSFEEAVRIRKQAEQDLFGEYACSYRQNVPSPTNT